MTNKNYEDDILIFWDHRELISEFKKCIERVRDKKYGLTSHKRAEMGVEIVVFFEALNVDLSPTRKLMIKEGKHDKFLTSIINGIKPQTSKKVKSSPRGLELCRVFLAWMSHYHSDKADGFCKHVSDKLKESSNGENIVELKFRKFDVRGTKVPENTILAATHEVEANPTINDNIHKPRNFSALADAPTDSFLGAGLLHVVETDGVTVIEAIKKFFVEIMSITKEQIQDLHIAVSDDYSGIIDYSTNDSYIKITGLGTILITQDKLEAALIAKMPTFANNFQMAGIGFRDKPYPHKKTEAQFPPIEDCVISNVFVRKLEQMTTNQLLPLLQQIFWTDACYKDNFWHSEGVAQRIVERLIKENRGDLVLKIVTDLSPSSMMTVWNQLNDVGWYLVKTQSNWMKQHGEDVCTALLEKSNDLNGPLIAKLKEILTQY